MQDAFIKRSFVRIALVVIVFTVAVCILIAALCTTPPGAELREAILAELQPVTLETCTLKRFGSVNDGGYLMCENLIGPLDAAYSYGVGGNDDWGCEVSRRYRVPVYEDDCFDPASPACDGGRFVFHDECVGDRIEYREIAFLRHAGKPDQKEW